MSAVFKFWTPGWPLLIVCAWFATCFGALSACNYQITNLLTSCGAVINSTASDCGIVSAHGFSSPGLSPDCRVSLPVATAASPRQLVLSVESAMVRNPHIVTRKCDSYFQILHDANATGTALPLSRKICSHEFDQQVFRVQGGVVIFLLHTRQARYTHLSVAYTSLVAGDCRNNTRQFKCPNTEFCIPNNLVCDGHNNCGDHSDESQQGGCSVVTSHHVNPLVSVACGVVILLLAVFGVFYCTRPREPKWVRMAKLKS